MKKHILLLLGIIACGTLFGQQDPQSTLYMLNPIMYNPALAGTANFYQIRTNHRFQWVGLKDAPITNSITAFGPHTKKDMGYGGSIIMDITGPTSHMGANGLYAYNISIQKDIRVSFGLNLGLMQYKVDGTDITLHDKYDPVLSTTTVYSTIVPDASAGVYVYNNEFYGGFSALHLLDVFSKNATQNVTGIDVLSTTYYLMGGWLKKLDREWTVEPTLIAKKVVPAPFQFEISTKIIYKNMLWGGLAFRTQDAFSVVMGYTYDKKLTIGYAFDLAVNDIRKYAATSHEIVIGYNFDRIKKVSAKKKKK